MTDKAPTATPAETVNGYKGDKGYAVFDRDTANQLGWYATADEAWNYRDAVAAANPDFADDFVVADWTTDHLTLMQSRTALSKEEQ